MDAPELTLYTEDVGTVAPPGVVALPRRPRWVISNLAYFAYQTRQARGRYRIEAWPTTDVVAFNNVLAGAGFYGMYAGPTVGFVNDYKNLRYRLTSTTVPQRVQRGVLKRLEGRAARAATVLAVNSEFLKAMVVEEYGLCPERVHVLYKGVNVDEFEAPYRGLPGSAEEPLRVLFAKSDWRIGGLPTLLEAVGRLAAQRAVHLRVAGTDGVAVPSVPSKARVDFLGIVDAERLKAELRDAHVFCTPSISEALGVANMEAMLSRVPVVATDVGGIPEVTGGGAHASQVPADDPGAIASALEGMCARPGETARRVEAARAYVRAKFSIKQSIAGFRECCALASERHAKTATHL